jgi:hypothetical protein
MALAPGGSVGRIPVTDLTGKNEGRVMRPVCVPSNMGRRLAGCHALRSGRAQQRFRLRNRRDEGPLRWGEHSRRSRTVDL